MHQLHEAGLASAIARLAVVGALALVGQQDVEARLESQGLEGGQVAAETADHDATLRTRPRSKSSAPIV